MVGQIRRGVLDFIGAARPSIADPFLPRKIEEGRGRRHPRVHRLQHLRHRRHDHHADPLHPEPDHGRGVAQGLASGADRRQARASDRVLVVGAGPAGLEAARALGQRGYEVHLAEATASSAGASSEARLPGLAAWARVRDWRVGQLKRWRTSRSIATTTIGAADVLEFGAERVVLATGATWRRDGYGRSNGAAIPGLDPRQRVHAGRSAARSSRAADGPVAAVRRRLVLHGQRAGRSAARGWPRGDLRDARQVVASWTTYTQEFRHVQKRLRSLGWRSSPGTTSLPSTAMEHNWSAYTAAANGA